MEKKILLLLLIISLYVIAVMSMQMNRLKLSNQEISTALEQANTKIEELESKLN